MKRNSYLLNTILCIIFLLGVTRASAQVTITSSDSLDCTHPCTELVAHLIGDAPINAGITEDDVYTSAIPIGFTFNFYGVNYTQVIIGANGNLSFNLADAGAYDPWPISAALLGNSSVLNNICGPWCDIDIFYTGTPVGTETYSTDGVAPNRKFSVTWCACSMFSCGTQLTTTQIIMYETTNIVEVHITQKPVCAGWNGGYAICGVQNAAGTAATAAPGRDYPSVWSIPPHEAWRFTPVGGGTSYTVASIPYAPIPYASSNLYWYNATTGAYIGMGDSINVCPTTPTMYKCGALGCADTSFGYYMVTPSGGISFTTTHTNPSKCGACDGSITINGLSPGLTDSVKYSIGAVPQPAFTVVIPASGSITISGLCAGVYDSIKVKAGTCWSAPAIDTLTNPPISMVGSFTNPTFCGACDGTINLTGLYPSSTYTVTYTLGGTAQPPVVLTTGATGAMTLTGLCAGTYANIIATLSSACVTPPIGPFILVNPPISMTGSSTNNSYCGVCDGTITLTGLYASTSYTITYSIGGVAQPPLTLISNGSGSITITGLCEGTYTNIIATITSSGGACATPPIGPFTIAPPPPPVLNVTGFTNPSQCGYCNGSITIKSVAPFSTDTVLYSFNGGATTSVTTIALADSSIVLTGLCAGSYTGFSVRIGSCIYTVVGSATLTTIPIVAAFDTAIHFGCHGDSVFFTNSSTTAPGASLYYIWNFGDGTGDTIKNPTHVYAQGTYTVTLIADNHICEDSMKMVLPLIHPLVASFTEDHTLVCQGQMITFTNTSTISSGYWGNFLWSFGNGATDTNKNTTYTYLHSGTYTVQLIAADWVPCHDTTSVNIQVDTISGIKMNLTDTVICQGTYMTCTGLYASVGNTGNVWNFGDGNSVINENPIMHGYDGTGVFIITVTANYRACPDTSVSRKVTVLPQPYMYLGPDTSICKGSESITVTDINNANTIGASWLWNNGQTGPSINVVEPGYYYATVNINNCYASDTIWVQNNCYMDIPNVFSPNGDGVNDYFFPRQYLTKGLTTFSMNIYNRWGQLIFESNTLDGRGWDGKLNNVDQPEGVYVYIIDVTFKDGQKEHHQGNVTLLR